MPRSYDYFNNYDSTTTVIPANYRIKIFLSNVYYVVILYAFLYATYIKYTILYASFLFRKSVSALETCSLNRFAVTRVKKIKKKIKYLLLNIARIIFNIWKTNQNIFTTIAITYEKEKFFGL